MISLNENRPCVSLIGMPGAGKSTVGRLLAEKMALAFLDTDYLLESLYATRLQNIMNYFGKEKFIAIEGQVIASLRATACVIATGGSVVYNPAALRHLAKLGKIVYLEVPLDEMQKRVARNPERGIAIGTEQTLEDLYEERKSLYEAASQLRYNTAQMSPEEICSAIMVELNTEDFVKDTNKKKIC